MRPRVTALAAGLAIGAVALGAGCGSSNKESTSGATLTAANVSVLIQPGVPSTAGKDAAREGGSCEAADAADGFIARVDIDARGLVIH